MHIPILGVLIVVLLFLPQYWVKHVLRKHGKERDDFPGTGGDMARHLLNKLNLEQVQVEVSNFGDHYDPISRTVRLTQDRLEGKTLAGVVVAAHEVGHAIQHHRQETLFNLRTRLAMLKGVLSRATPLFFLVSPFFVFLNPAISRWTLLAALVSLTGGVLLNLITLPVEWDASFGKALPMLESGQYLSDQDMKYARTLLQAAALTYVAGSLSSIASLNSLIRIFMRR